MGRDGGGEVDGRGGSCSSCLSLFLGGLVVFLGWVEWIWVGLGSVWSRYDIQQSVMAFIQDSKGWTEMDCFPNLAMRGSLDHASQVRSSHHCCGPAVASIVSAIP